MSGAPWNERLRGVVLYEDGVQVPGSGRVSGIDFLNSSLSYNRITGIATVSIGEAVDLSVTPNRLLGRYSSPAGPHQEITPSGNIELTALGVLQRGALTGDVTATAGSGSTSFRSAPGLTVLGRSGGTSGPLADITGVTDGHVLRIASGALAFGAIVAASLGDIPTDRLIGRDTAGTGAAEHISVGGGIEFTGSGGIQSSAYTGDVTKAAGATVTAFRAFAALSVLSNATNGSAVPTDVASNADHQVFRRNGTALAWGTVATAGITDNAVTFAKFQTIATDRLVGRDTASTGNVEEISLGSSLEFSGSQSIQRAALTGDVTAAANSNTTAFRGFSALSVLGRSANSLGAPADIVGTDGQVFRIASNVLGFGTIATAGVGDNQITFAKFQQIGTDRLVGRDTAGTGNVEEISLNSTLEFTDGQSIQRAALTGAVTASAGSNTTAFGAFAALTVLANATNGSAVPSPLAAGANDRLLARTSDALSFTQLTNGMVATNTIGLDKLANIATDSLLGRDTAGTGAVENITLNATLSMTGAGALQRAALTGDVTASAGSNTTAFRSMTARSVLARAANSSGVPAELSGGGANTVLYDNGTTLTFGTLPSAAVTAPGSTGQVLYNNANALDAASGITVVGTETAFAFGTSPAQVLGLIRVAHGATVIGSRNATDNGDFQVLRTGVNGNNSVTLGSTGVTNGLFYITASGTGHTWHVDTNTELTLSATALNVQGNDVTNAAFFGGSGTVAGAGLLRGAHGGTIVGGRDNANAANAALMAWGVGATDRLTHGDTEVAEQYRNIATGGTYVDQINGSAEYTKSSSTLRLHQNSLTDAGFIGNGQTASLPASGFIRIAEFEGTFDVMVATISGSPRTLISASSTGPLVTFGGTTCDTAVVGEHTQTGYLGAQPVWSFEDDGDGYVSGMNVANASAKSFLVRAPGSTSSNNAGGVLYLRGGRRSGVGAPGPVAMQLNIDDSSLLTMVEASMVGGTAVLSLCKLDALTTTEMPSNTGDGVAYFANAFTNPTTGVPVDGALVWCSAGVLAQRSERGGTYDLGWQQSSGSPYQASVRHYASPRTTLAAGSDNATVASYTLDNLVHGSGDCSLTIICDIQAKRNGSNNYEFMGRKAGFHRASGSWSSDGEGPVDIDLSPDLLDLSIVMNADNETLEIQLDNSHGSNVYQVNTFLTFLVYAL